MKGLPPSSATILANIEVKPASSSTRRQENCSMFDITHSTKAICLIPSEYASGRPAQPEKTISKETPAGAQLNEKGCSSRKDLITRLVRLRHCCGPESEHEHWAESAYWSHKPLNC